MKLLVTAILLSSYLLASGSYPERDCEYIYAGLPSYPLEDEDSGDDLEEDSAPQGDDSRGSGKSDDAPPRDGNERYEDWYEPEHDYE